MKKHEWRKKEKLFYLPKNRPEVIDIPAFKFLAISGEGNPNGEHFADCISVLYGLSYPIKMGFKKREQKPEGYCDYTVYPLEGIWDLTEEGRKNYTGQLNKDELAFKLMIRQPDFVDETYFNEVLETVKVKKPNALLDEVKLERITDGKCVQMLHLGSYDDEPESFRLMEAFAEEEGLVRQAKSHREIYLSDFRKVPAEKLKTVLRFHVQ